MGSPTPSRAQPSRIFPPAPVWVGHGRVSSLERASQVKPRLDVELQRGICRSDDDEPVPEQALEETQRVPCEFEKPRLLIQPNPTGGDQATQGG